ncbi:MAG: MFS transporter [Chloroflexi bacterium]|nr:MFS transporter [Chloroflexota bacterium]
MKPPVMASVPWRIVAGLAVGNLLNPLNSSMIAVALVSLSGDFGVSLGTVTWVVSAFYLGGMVGMPLMGQLTDRFGARRMLTVGLVLVGVTSALAPLTRVLAVLLGLRLLQAVGTSAPYPAALAIFRARNPGGRAPAGALGAISITNSVSSALGPVLGGALVAFAGWQAIFAANVPLAALALLLAFVWLPRDQVARESSARKVRVWSLLRSKALVAVYAQFALVNVVFYGVFYGLPLWLEQTRHYAPDLTGLILLPVAGIGVLATPVAARLIDRMGPRPSLIIGSVVLLLGSLLLLRFGSETALLELLVVGAVLGVPNGFNNLGLQAALYEAAASDQIGAAAGLLQTFRYAGAIASTAIIGAVFGADASSNSLHVLALVMAVTSAALVLASIFAYRPSSAE